MPKLRAFVVVCLSHKKKAVGLYMDQVSRGISGATGLLGI